MTDNANNVITASTTGGSQSLTNVDNTISGAGFIGRFGGNNLTLVNQAKGVVDANGTNTLILDASSSGTVTNAGLIESTGAGGLTLESGTFANSGKIADSGAGALTLVNATIDDTGGGTLSPGGSLILENGTVLGGTLSVGAGQAITVNAFLVGTVATTSLTNQGTITIQNGGALLVQDAVDNTGSITLGATAQDTFLEIGAAGATLSGGGTVTMADNANNV